ncbi:MAG TPA: ABC transporter substrate-binding protein [Chloroflexota bacterium]
MVFRGVALMGFALMTVVAGCAAPQGRESAGTSGAPAAPKRIVAAISGDPRTVYSSFGANGVRGADVLNILLNSGLANLDHTATMRPLLAQEVPSVENGLWQVFPDGTMDLSWRVRDGAKWHDGTPLTFDDFAFTVQVLQDGELPFPLESAALKGLQGVEAVDSRTVRLHWSALNINADRIFAVIGPPLPRHLLENTYQDNKPNFTDLPYWSSAFIGNGPYKIRDWEPGTLVRLQAFDGYVLGRPKIDEIELRYILDPAIMVSNVLAGDIDITLGRNFSPEQAAGVRRQWQEGRVDVGLLSSALNIWPQFIDPSPTVLLDVRFKRALFRALDRETMADVLEGGLTPVAQSWLLPNLPEYPSLEHYIVKYDYDTRAAAQEIEGIGYTRGPDGMFRDGGGQPLAVELRTTQLPEINAQTQLTVQNDWQKAGLTVDLNSRPPQSTDPLYTVTYPGLYLVRYPADVFTGAGPVQARVVKNGRYQHPDLDVLMEKFEKTMARSERLDITGQIIRHMTDQVTVMTLFYDPGTGFVRNRLLNVPPLGDQIPWNAWEWDVK